MRYLFPILLLFAATGLSAQSNIRELGVRFSSLESFGLLYKRGLDDGRYRRYNFALFDLSLAALEGGTVGAFSVSASIGTEKRVSIAPSFKFAHGWQPGAGLSIVTTDGAGVITLSPSVGYLIGFQYHVSERFYFGVEAIPSISLGIVLGEISGATFNAGISSTGVGLTTVYRFIPE